MNLQETPDPQSAVDNPKSSNNAYRNKRKKSNFLTKAKKFGRQGKLGRGYEVSNETYHYFVRVLELLRKNEFECEEDKELFIENSLRQTEGNEVDFSSNQMISRVLEYLLPVSSNEVILRFTSAFSPELRTICSDPYASHVLETLLEICFVRSNQAEEIHDWMLTTCKFTLNNFEEFVFSNYSNRVMRTACQCLSGHFLNLKFMEHSQDSSLECKEFFKSFAQRLIDWPQFCDLLEQVLTAGFVQIFLQCLKHLDSSLANDGMAKVIDAIQAPLECEDVAKIYTLEVCMKLSNKKIMKAVFEKYLKNHLVEFALNENGYHIVKNFIVNCKNAKLFSEMAEELLPRIEKIFAKRHNAVIFSLSAGCGVFNFKQSEYIDGLKSCIGLKEDDNNNLFLSIIALKPISVSNFDYGLSSFTMDGALIAQNVIRFSKPLEIVKSALDLDANSLSKICSHPKGSHVMESLFASSSVNQKFKEKILSKLLINLHDVARNKFGSRVLDCIWATANIKCKEMIASNLASHIAQLQSDRYGKFLSEKCALRYFKSNPKQWLQVIEKSEQKKKPIKKSKLEFTTEETPTKEPKVQVKNGKAKKSKKSKRKSQADDEVTSSLAEEEEKEQACEDVPKKKKKKLSKNTD